ncbi:MAG: HAMP domain-containing protein, partial [Phycisphaerales bacterium]|nr:HAMP domain-containing protein [Phycisphaerales bacterium]
MTLQRKFAVLFLLLGLAAIVNIAVGAWTVGTLRRELTWPLESIQEVMRGLHGVKRAAEDQLDALGYGRGPGQLDEAVEPTDERRTAFDRGVERMRRQAAFLNAESSYEMRSGIASSRNLQARVDEAIRFGHAWFDGDEGARASARQALNQIHELIERTEGHVLEDARLAVDFGDRIQRQVIVVVGVALLILVGSTITAVRLVRAWVLRPVERLRDAASRIGQGDFEHRIGLEGADEMAQLAREVDEMAELVSTMQDEAVDRERLAAMGEMTRRIVHNLRNP